MASIKLDKNYIYLVSNLTEWVKILIESSKIITAKFYEHERGKKG